MIEKKVLQAGIIGSGFAAKFHYDALQRVYNTKVEIAGAVEKIGTKQGWSFISPDEGWFAGYQHELDAFYKSAAYGDAIESNSSLAADVTATIYAGYISAQKKGEEVSIPIL